MVIITQGGRDVIRSCAGANTITPSGGADTIYLEYGHTTLRYESLTDSTLTATDGISFFTHGRDKIDLTGLGLLLASQEVLEAAQTATTARTSLSAALDVFAKLIGRNSAGYFSYGDYIYAFGNNGASAFSSTEALVIRIG